MTEREFYNNHLEEIAEIITEARRLTDPEYEEWKHGCLENLKAKQFTKKLFTVIDYFRN